MTTHTLDTSGMVGPFEPRIRLAAGAANYLKWIDLDPFTQGYVEAAFRSLRGDCAVCGGFGQIGVRADGEGFPEACPDCVLKGFSNLHSATLAAILKDCAAFSRSSTFFGRDTSRIGGASFWTLRQRGALPSYPPLTVTLGDDGKVRLELAATEGRSCTCHPDDNPPSPCAQRYALSDCLAKAEDQS